MASFINSDGEEALALVLRLSRLPLDDFDEQIAQLLPNGSASANRTSRPCTPINDQEDDLALALELSMQSPDNFDEQDVQLPHTQSTPISRNARSCTPPNENYEISLEQALYLSQLPADIFDEQVSELNRRWESRTAAEDRLASFLTGMSLVEVCMTPFLWFNESLTFVPG